MASNSHLLSRGRSLSKARLSQELASLSNMIESVCVDIEEAKDQYYPERHSPRRLNSPTQFKFTKERKYREGKAGLIQVKKCDRDSNGKFSEMKDLLRFSKRQGSPDLGFLNREMLGSEEVRKALLKYKRRFGESSPLQCPLRHVRRRPAVMIPSPPLFQVDLQKEKRNHFINNYINTHLRRQASLSKAAWKSALPSPSISPLVSPSHSPTRLPTPGHDISSGLKYQLAKLQKPPINEDLDYISDENLLNEIKASSSLLMKDQGRIKNFMKEKFRVLRISGRHLEI